MHFLSPPPPLSLFSPDFDVIRDNAAFDLMRGETAIIIRTRLEIEASEVEEDDGGEGGGYKSRRNPHGQWVRFKERKPLQAASKKQNYAKEKHFYYNKVGLSAFSFGGRSTEQAGVATTDYRRSPSPNVALALGLPGRSAEACTR